LGQATKHCLPLFVLLLLPGLYAFIVQVDQDQITRRRPAIQIATSNYYAIWRLPLKLPVARVICEFDKSLQQFSSVRVILTVGNLVV
jgi:hypothetical protein